MKTKVLHTIFSIFVFGVLFSQNPQRIKEYREKLATTPEDSTRVECLNDLSVLHQRNKFTEAYDYALQAYDLAIKLNNIRGKVKAINNIGDAYWYNGDFITAQRYYYKGFRINDSIKDKKGIAESLYNIGWIIVMQQKNFKEVHYLTDALRIYEELKEVEGTAGMLNTLGQYYSDLYFTQKKKEFFDSSLVYFEKVIRFAKANEELKKFYSAYYGNLGELMGQAGDYVSAKFYMEKKLAFELKRGDSTTYYFNLGDMSNFEFHLGNTDKAIEQASRCYAFASRNHKKDILTAAAGHLNEYYYSKKEIIKAYDYFQEFVTLKDSTDQQLFSANLNDIQNGYELEKKENSINQLKQTNEIQELKNQRGNYFLIGALIIVGIILVILYLLAKQNKQKNIANARLSEQNGIITQKKDEIDKSIKYAKGIQNAVLPDPNDIKEIFKESFIFYEPKDVVSGDFYWFHDSYHYFYCIAADCTGHGVPGALMSIVSMDKLNQAIFEKKLVEPVEILSFLNVEIKRALKQQNDEAKQKDGLDIALLRFDKKNNLIHFAGANRPLYLVRDQKLMEYKADKVAIAGFTPNEFEFHQQEIVLQAKDCIYLSSDGYADQFGGKDGKKFMTKNLKSLLEKISTKAMNEQKEEIVAGFSGWKGTHEQVDDVLIIGIRV